MTSTPKEGPRLVVFSGAGLSAESGLPTFRGGSDGLWEGHSLEVVCNFQTWQKNFDEVHRFYDARRTAAWQAQPNAGHRQIALWQRQYAGHIVILTQNVDDLLERAGCTDVVHLHGEARRMRCVACAIEWEITEPVYDQTGCPHCHRLKTVKPAIIFFGEPAPKYNVLMEVVASLLGEDTAVVVGTSGAVLPADELFGQSRAYSILVNLESGSHMDESLFDECHFGPATRQLPALADRIARRMGI